MKSNSVSIIYYTANLEDPKFEKLIQDNLLKAGLPIISVSHKPINFGHNICVGEKPLAYSNVLRQTLIALKEAKTEFCIAAEDDCLYPPEYFTFTPPLKDQVYRYTNIYVHFDGRDKFWKKKYVEGAQMCGREHWIKSIEKIIKNDNWEPIPINPPFVFSTKDEYSWTGENPVIYFKTRASFKFKTGFEKGSVDLIPYWGTALEVKNKYLK